MWELYLICLNNSILYILNLSKGYSIKVLLIFLNNLYLSLILITIIFLQRTFLNFFFQAIIVIFFYKLYFLEIQNFFLLKYILTVNNFYHFFFNLLIGLILIHPPLFYITTLLWLKTVFLNLLNMNIYVYNIYKLFINLTITLILGGFWGWLNFAWGYFWVYDYIEYLLAFIIFQFLYKIHTKNYKIFLTYNIWFFLCILTLYIVIRYSLLPSRHTFFNKISRNKYKYIYILLMFINYLNIFIQYFYLFLFFSTKLLSLYLVYISSLFICWFFFNFQIISSLLIYIIHLFVIYTYYYVTIHSSNYFYLIKHVLVLNTPSLIYNNLNYIYNCLIYQLDYSIKLKHKYFISNVFKNFNNIFSQKNNKTFIFYQLNYDINIFIICCVLIFILILYKQW